MSGQVLTEALIRSKMKVNSLEDIHNLNMWGNHLSDVSFVAKLPNVETITLSVNEISSLEPFSRCPKLQELFLRRNQISSLRELFHLQKLSHLRVLWLSDNPIVDEPDYRLFTIACLSGLTKLDEADITPEERQKAQAKFPHPETLFASPTKSSSSDKKEKEPAKEKEKEGHKKHRSGSVQGHILGAIEILIQDLDEAGLAVLADMVAARRKK